MLGIVFCASSRITKNEVGERAPAHEGRGAPEPCAREISGSASRGSISVVQRVVDQRTRR